ncbi:PDDEXK family nuclease [Rhodococcoides fascians]|uniref:hypothetical protein n=1 Tax=Rhodococcoides fascians TaxID=1828 RepID=UPI00367233BB
MVNDETARFLVRELGSQGGWASPEMSAYDNEDHLQRIIAAAPEHVPGVSDSALTVRELATSAGPADVCIVDREGSVTVVECKLASNTERRRMVIGQVLDYASAISLGGEASFRRQWARRGGVDLGVLEEEAVERLAENIATGRVHLCLAVDRIDADLRRLVEYLNRITRVEIRVTALQLAYARHGGLEILVPSTYGGELADAKAHSSGGSAGPVWTKVSFLEAVLSEGDRALAEKLFDLQEALDVSYGTHDDFWFGTPPRGAVFFHPFGYRYPPMSLWINKSGQLMASGSWTKYPHIATHDGFAELAAFLGQNHMASAPGRRVSDLDLEKFWSVVLDCAQHINA